ncbi:ATP-binding cassette domain-containing protein [Terrilactibacillus sp. BCM23-1]|uniref:ATP-binding cassette domain-containing protein n=1 Tax=Terrilactibacillus tamarindi TaxID=2599694 RepID=A0A6N8CT78_9BACI|nr:ABC transporter ATP-binding protein [Terrilactibacillus tamarindi]MTT32868.1 ATP-binding cassette domain-containing protein [Terrilactibacillus tamarindi]
MSFVIEMRNIRKEFPGVVANDNITLQVEKGEIHALLGENGAGKSTLMNVLFGLYQPDKGEIYVKGKKVHISDPNVANELGIGMVHQHFMLIDKFTVAENIILGSEPTKYGQLNLKEAIKVVQGLSDKYNLDVNPMEKVENISVGMQQRVEILKTLYRGSDILIFDEPTAVLTPQEIKELMNIMKTLVQEGKSIILITHKLKEIMEVCHRCTVIRLGKSIDTVHISEATPDQLATMMVGRKVDIKVNDQAYDPKETVLDIRGLKVLDSRKVSTVDGLDLKVHGHEIVGIAGVDGNGQTELVEAIAGLRKIKEGSISLNGQDVTNKRTRKITEAGLGYIPEDRHKHGLVLDFSVRENIVLQTYYKNPYSKAGILNNKKITKKAKELIKEYDVRTPSELTLARSLSGGNQQKAIIAREIDRSPELLIAAQPTRGLDVGAIEFIHGKLLAERNKGKAVLLVSFELDEILNLSDRIAVIYEGKIIDIVNAKETNENELGLLMAGHRKAVKEG